MNKDDAKTELEKNLPEGEQLVGLFMAMTFPNFWWYVLVGPLAALKIKTYFVGVTNKGLHLHQLNLAGKFSLHRYIPFNEVLSLKLGRGFMKIPMRYTLSNGEIIKLNAQKVGVERVAKIEANTIAHLKQQIKEA